MSREILKKLMSEFEEPGEFSVLQGRRRKRILNETAKEVALAVFERAYSSRYSSASTRAVMHPNVVRDQSLHPNYITVRGGFTADFILGPLF